MIFHAAGGGQSGGSGGLPFNLFNGPPASQHSRPGNKAQTTQIGGGRLFDISRHYPTERVHHTPHTHTQQREGGGPFLVAKMPRRLRVVNGYTPLGTV